MLYAFIIDLSSVQKGLYRGNFIDLTVNARSGFTTSDNKICINKTPWPTEYGDYAISELIMFDELLDLAEIECIEKYILIQ